MNRLVKPVDPCQNCKQLASCIEVAPPPQFHSGWECTHCHEIRWGGVLSAAGPLRIGYTFSGGSLICWRCHRAHCDSSASNYPKLPYLQGFMTTLWSDDKGTLDRHCDECGVLVDENC